MRSSMPVCLLSDLLVLYFLSQKHRKVSRHEHFSARVCNIHACHHGLSSFMNGVRFYIHSSGIDSLHEIDPGALGYVYNLISIGRHPGGNVAEGEEKPSVRVAVQV